MKSNTIKRLKELLGQRGLEAIASEAWNEARLIKLVEKVEPYAEEGEEPVEAAAGILFGMKTLQDEIESWGDVEAGYVFAERVFALALEKLVSLSPRSGEPNNSQLHKLARQAMKSILRGDDGGSFDPDVVAENAYATAKAMIEKGTDIDKDQSKLVSGEKLEEALEAITEPTKVENLQTALAALDRMPSSYRIVISESHDPDHIKAMVALGATAIRAGENSVDLSLVSPAGSTINCSVYFHGIDQDLRDRLVAIATAPNATDLEAPPVAPAPALEPSTKEAPPTATGTNPDDDDIQF